MAAAILKRGSTQHEDQEALSHTRRYWNDSSAVTLLADLARDGETKASGRVQLISLADFRESIGPLWEKYEERILVIAETTIARMIGKGRTFIPMKDKDESERAVDTWLLLLPDLELDAARDHAAAIAAKIGEKLAGAQFAAEEAPLPQSATLDLTGAMNTDGSLNRQVLRTAVGRARRSQTNAAHAPVNAPGEPRRLQASAMLRPAWCVDTEMEDTFLLRPKSTMGQDLVADSTAPFPEIVATNLCAAAARQLEEMGRKGLRARLALPIPYAMFYAPIAATLRDSIMAMPKQLRLLHLRLEIVRVPAAISVDRLAVLRELFRPAVREVAFLVDAFASRSDVYALDQIVIGADLSAARGWDEAELRAALTRMADAAADRHTYVVGLRNAAHVRIAFTAGIDEIGGESLSVDIAQLPDQLRLIPRATVTAP